jgi:uncharacterized protein YegP (UPF0339 family)
MYMAAKFELKRASNGQFLFNLKAPNGEVILTSELYVEKSSAEHGIEATKANAVEDSRYERRNSKTGAPYFVLKAGNGEVIGKSEMYSSVSALDGGIASVKKNAPAARVEDTTAA